MGIVDWRTVYGTCAQSDETLLEMLRRWKSLAPTEEIEVDRLLRLRRRRNKARAAWMEKGKECQ